MYALSFTWDFTPATILSAITVVGGFLIWWRSRGRLDDLIVRHEQILALLSKQLEDHKTEDTRRFENMEKESKGRFERLEQQVVNLVGGVQRLIGQTEIRVLNRERRERDLDQ